jgi:hypothetical protein
MEFITHRQPTEFDGDCDGDVRQVCNPNSNNTVYMHWSLVPPGVKWTHSDLWHPPATPKPTPAPKPELKGASYTLSGSYWEDETREDKDLVALIADATEPAPAPHPEKPQVGQVWKTRAGTYVTITGQDAAGCFTCTTNHFIQRADLLEPITHARVPRLFAAPLRRTLSKDGNTCIVDAFADDGTCWICQLGVDFSRKHLGEEYRTEWQQITPLPDREEPTNV